MTDSDLTEKPALEESADIGRVSPTERQSNPAPGTTAGIGSPGQGSPGPRQEAPPPPRPKRSRTGRWILLFIIVLIGLGAAAWWYLPDLREKILGLFDDDELALRLDAADRARNALDDRTRQLRDEVERLQREVAGHEQTLAAMRNSLTEMQAEALVTRSNQGAPRPREWQLAETEYLLRMANHRLLLERDIVGARAMLEAADAVLAGLSDLALFEVRTLLADEILALRAAEDIDVTSIYLRLETLKAGIDRLPLKLPEYQRLEDADPSRDVQADDADVLDRLFSLVRFRQHDTPGTRPLLSPLEAEYLEQHLRLSLDRGQLLVLRRDQASFRANLVSMRKAIIKTLSINDPRVAVMIEELDSLGTLNLEAALPDISASLRRLGELRGSYIPAAPGIPATSGEAPAAANESPDAP